MTPTPHDRSAEVLAALRDVAAQLGRLTDTVGSNLRLRPGDLDCLDVIARRGPMSPSAVAAELGVRPTTLTGIVDRLESGGWLRRTPDPKDRRKITLTADPARGRELVAGFRPMRAATRSLCAGYSPEEIETILTFLRRVSEAGRASRPPAEKGGHASGGVPANGNAP